MCFYQPWIVCLPFLNLWIYSLHQIGHILISFFKYFSWPPSLSSFSVTLAMYVRLFKIIPSFLQSLCSLCFTWDAVYYYILKFDHFFLRALLAKFHKKEFISDIVYFVSSSQFHLVLFLDLLFPSSLSSHFRLPPWACWAFVYSYFNILVANSIICGPLSINQFFLQIVTFCYFLDI